MFDYTAYNSELLKCKIGYLLSKLDPCSLEDLNNCLYLLDDYSVKETGVPFTWLKYRVFSSGPVCELMYAEFVKGIKYRSMSEIFGMSDYLSCPGRKWTNTVSIDEITDDLYETDKDFIDSKLDILNGHINNNTWLFGFINTIFQKYSMDSTVTDQWDHMGGESFTTINWFEHIDTEEKKANYINRFQELF